jgi:hypothetical protein
MDKPFYQFEVLNEARRFDFISIGKKEICKTITFSQTEVPSIYILTLGNVLPNKLLDTDTISNNGDMEMILATVFKAISIFLSNNPDAIIGFTGSCNVRTRLYQIAISREIISLNKRFNVWGVTDEDVEFFGRGRCYNGFFISFKSVNIAQFI